jgi:hypothetical protein
MTTALILLLAFNTAALAGVLALARHDAQLVDEDGRPLDANWQERLIPASRPPLKSTPRTPSV